jgi:hypothetical protein
MRTFDVSSGLQDLKMPLAMFNDVLYAPTFI